VPEKKPGIGFVNMPRAHIKYTCIADIIEGELIFLIIMLLLSGADTNGYRTNNDLETTDFNSNLT